jgi:hypothetical protein
MRGKFRRSPLALGSTVVAVGILGSGTAVAYSPTPPRAAWSYYVNTVQPARLHDMGCELGRAVAQGQAPRDALVVLAFGRPMYSFSNHGASVFTGFEPTFRLRQAAQAYAAGYAWCSRGELGTHLRVALGTSNYGDGVSYWHGRAWAHMVNTANHWARAQRFRRRVDFAGANDIEPGWGPPGPARAWADGYDSANRWPYYFFGGASGCPPYGDCEGSWTMEDMWYVSWGAKPAYPLPQVYNASGAAAEQWYRLSLYSYLEHGRPMAIQGVMTQRQACLDMGDPCDGLKIWPGESWRMLWQKLNADPRTAQQLRWATDIRWNV